MAELHKARVVGPEGFDKLVAVKRILPTFSSNEAFTKMFIDEARLAGSLNHPNLAQTFELGRDVDDNLFISMELVVGVELAVLVERMLQRKKRMPEAAALEVLVQVLRGLHHAHTKKDLKGQPLGLIHRDVTPSNILVTPEGVSKLLDFGVAKAKGRLTETQAGMVKGKLLYMSPEQSRNKSIDHRTDQFAVGLVLWECLVGEACYTFGSEFELMKAVGYGQTRSLESVGVQVHPELNEALFRALQPNPEDRFGSCEEFANALLRFKQRRYPNYTPTQLGNLVREYAGDIIDKVAHVPDLDGEGVIPLHVSELAVSNIGGNQGGAVNKKVLFGALGVGLVGAAVGGFALYSNLTAPPPEREEVVVVAQPAVQRTVTVTRVVDPGPRAFDLKRYPDAGYHEDGGPFLMEDGGPLAWLVADQEDEARKHAEQVAGFLDAGLLEDGGTPEDAGMPEVADAGGDVPALPTLLEDGGEAAPGEVAPIEPVAPAPAPKRRHKAAEPEDGIEIIERGKVVR